MKGEWILKEVYFEDGWPSVIRDPVRPVQEPVAWEQLHEHMAGPFYKAPRPWVGHDRGSTGEVPGKLKPVGKFAQFTDGIWREVTKGSNGVFLYQREEQ